MSVNNMCVATWELQAAYDTDLNPPTFNTAHGIFTNNQVPCKLWSVIVQQTNDELANKDVDIYINCGGTAQTTTGITMQNGVNYGVIFYPATLNAALHASDEYAPFISDEGGSPFTCYPIEDRTIYITIKMTSALGTNQRIQASCGYQLLRV